MKSIFVSSFNSDYFQSGLTQIASIHRTSLNVVDEIVVYNLGLTAEEIEFLNRLVKVQVINYPDAVNHFFPGFLTPKQFAWKPFAIKDAARFGDRILYLDAGAMVLQNIDIIYHEIEQTDIFLVKDIYQTNHRWTHPRAFELLGATEEEKQGNQLWAGLIGYKVNGRFQNLIDEAYQYAQNQEIIFGSHENHRHDQSIYSVLAIRYHCPTQFIESFGEWRGIINPNQVIYVHRRGYHNVDGLLFRS